MKPGEDVLLIDKGLTNKWRWAWIEEIGKDSKPFGSSCKKLRAAGACSCTLCWRKLIYSTSSKKVLPCHADITSCPIITVSKSDIDVKKWC